MDYRDTIIRDRGNFRGNFFSKEIAINAVEKEGEEEEEEPRFDSRDIERTWIFEGSSNGSGRLVDRRRDMVERKIEGRENKG